VKSRREIAAVGPFGEIGARHATGVVSDAAPDSPNDSRADARALVVLNGSSAVVCEFTHRRSRAAKAARLRSARYRDLPAERHAFAAASTSMLQSVDAPNCSTGIAV
jgi:hypothetical protein